MILNDFRRCYPAKPSRLALGPGEDIQMTSSDGLLSFSAAPLDDPRHITSSLPYVEETAKETRYLWVLTSTDLPQAWELCPFGKSLPRGVIKHTNLTGNTFAHGGGEVWFIDASSVVVNANSGRYGCSSETEFNEFVECLISAGYNVCSTGFDLDNPLRPNALLVGPANWKFPP